jgi:nucleoside-diphosphate-sugar epimerase
MNLVIIGGTGFVGRHLVTALSLKPSYKLTLLIHKKKPDWVDLIDGVNLIYGDILDKKEHTGAYS